MQCRPYLRSEPWTWPSGIPAISKTLYTSYKWTMISLDVLLRTSALVTIATHKSRWIHHSFPLATIFAPYFASSTSNLPWDRRKFFPYLAAIIYSHLRNLKVCRFTACPSSSNLHRCQRVLGFCWLGCWVRGRLVWDCGRA